MARDLRTDARSHELWRERPERERERERETREALRRRPRVRSYCPNGCRGWAFRGRPEPERQFVTGVMAEDWKPRSNGLHYRGPFRAPSAIKLRGLQLLARHR
jgi:hypothetical protein